MARQPFFGQGPGPLIARMDMNAATAIGREYGKAFREMGQAAGSAANAFIQRKNEKKRVDSSTNAFIQLGFEPDVAKAMAKDPNFQNAAMKKEALDQQGEIARMGIRADIAKANRARSQEAAKMEMEEEKEKVRQKAESDYFGKLYSSAPTGELNEAGKEEVANFQAFAPPEDPRTNAFIQETLQNPEFQQTEPVMDMTGNRFAQQFAGESPEVQRMAFNFMQARQKDAPSISRVVNIQDEQGGFQQVGFDNAGNPIKSFGPPKPSGMYRTPEEARKEKILVGRTEDAMKSVKSYVEGSSLAIKQAEQANLALKNIPNTTGGITSFVNDMKVLAESVGIDLPEDYTEDMKDIGLFRQLTGQFLFDAMENTKGSITENEMRLFRRISPDIDNSKAANEAMLGLYVKAGARAKGRRNLIRGLQEKDVDPREIERTIEKFDEENSLMDDIQALAPQSEQQTFRIGQKQVEGEVVGKKPDGSLIVKTKDGKIFVQPAQ